VVALIRQQLLQDWDALADTLDREFTDALAAWRTVFDSLVIPPDRGPLGDAA
jgi:hypothetical protein